MSDETPFRLLVVDSNPEDRNTYRRLLSSNGEDDWEIAEVASAQEALEQCRHHKPTCILLEYHLPDETGLDLLSKLTDEYGLPSVPAVVVTSHGDESVAVEAMKRGAQDYLVKGRFKAEALPDAIRGAVTKFQHLQKGLSQSGSSTVWVLEKIGVTDSLSQVEIRPLPFRIGRGPRCSLRLRSRKVSKEHAEIYSAKNHLRIRDLGSSNGTQVNGESVGESRGLHHGDVVRLADIEFQVRKLHPDTVLTTSTTSLAIRLAMESMVLARLLNGEDVIPCFQPIVRISNSERLGYEAFVDAEIEGVSVASRELFTIASRHNVEDKLSRALRWQAISVSSRLPDPGVVFLSALALEVNSPEFIPSIQALRESFPQAKAAFIIPQEVLADLPAIRRVRDALTPINFDLAIGDYVPSQARSRAIQTLGPRFVIFAASQIREARASSQKKQRLETAVDDLHDSEIQIIAPGIASMEDQVMCAHLNFDFAQGSLFGKLTPRAS